MLLEAIIEKEVKNCLIQELGWPDAEEVSVQLGSTRKDFAGDVTVVTFPYVKTLKKNPSEVADTLGKYLVDRIDDIVDYNVIKGFLNLSFSRTFWKRFIENLLTRNDFGHIKKSGKKVMVEFSSPNTNKPLHLGHVRNILIGWSCSMILEAAGYEVIKTQIVNDRGIAICKSMLSWLKFANGLDPAAAHEKGDHFVGDYYVGFEKALAEEYEFWKESEDGLKVYQELSNGQDKKTFFKSFKNKYFNQYSALGREARDLLLKWEEGDETTIALWKKMNGWVYDGFNETYENLGVSFDKLYYESETWKLGKKAVFRGLENEVFYRKEDGSVWVDLTKQGMDEKILLRSDGTSVYMTQDLGTAMLRFQDFGVDKMVYVVADEQNYHFKVLFEILKLLKEPYAEGLFHLSYGMVELPGGRMKTREGKVVDADDLITEVIGLAGTAAREKGGLEELSAEEQERIIEIIALAAIKFQILKVHPQKRMIFNPEESIDLQGQTGPYIQNAYVRISSILRKHGSDLEFEIENLPEIEEGELHLLQSLYQYPSVIQEAAESFDPSTIANYGYDLAKTFHRFYHDYPVLSEQDIEKKQFRLLLSKGVANILKQSMNLLGIKMPEKM